MGNVSRDVRVEGGLIWGPYSGTRNQLYALLFICLCSIAVNVTEFPSLIGALRHRLFKTLDGIEIYIIIPTCQEAMSIFLVIESFLFSDG